MDLSKYEIQEHYVQFLLFSINLGISFDINYW
jgi:hypothetical protein